MANPNLPFPSNAYDDLADLFLTEPAESSDPHAAHDDPDPLPFPGRAATPSSEPRTMPAERPRIISILRVNLPVIAGPWLEQAAASIAAREGPVVLLRERGHQTSIDLVAGRDGQTAVAAAQTAPTSSLPAAIAQLGSAVAYWIVESPAATEPGHHDWSHIDELVLLTGADEAATVAAFAQAKAICTAAAPPPRLSLVVVGSDDATARRAAGRIIKACEDSLECAISLRAVIRRMHPVPMRHLGRFPCESELVNVLASALTAPPNSVSADVQAPAVPQPRADAPTNRVALRPRLQPQTSDPPVPEAPRPAARVATPRPTRVKFDGPSPPASTEAMAPEEPDVRRAADSPAAASASEPETQPAQSLLSRLSELRPLNAVCPRAAQVELGFDGAGRLHALIDSDVEGALQQLLVASDWLREHHALLLQLNPWLAAAPHGGSEPVLHLFTTRPRQWRHLADGAIRIHIVWKDDADGGRIVDHTDLN